MEETEPVGGLSDTREQLSRMLLRRPRRDVITGQTDTAFPRSNLMRFLLDPGKRGLWVAGATTVALLFPSLTRVGRLGTLATLVGRVTKTISQRRR
jgi:hypothetical protein